MFPTAIPLQRKIVWLVVLFLLLGQIALFSATAVLGIQKHSSEFYYVIRQAACAIIGVFLMLGIAKVPYQTWAKFAHPLLFIQIILVAATRFSPFGHYASGATRWLRVGPLLFQPSELAKISVTIYFANLLARHRVQPLSAKKWVFNVVPILLCLFLIFKQPDLGTSVLLVLTMIGMLFIAGIRLSYLLGVLGTGAIGFTYSVMHYEWRRKRLFAFLNPWADPQGTGFQTIQSFLSFHSGKLLGTGIGNGNSKLFYLPEVHTDFIFALIGEEAGFIGAIFIVALFLYFSYLLFKVAFQSHDAFSCYLSFGLSLALVLQIAVNLGGVTGILPVKGLPLPFISWGRSALLVNLALMGILLNIIRSSPIITATENSEEEIEEA